MDEALATRGLRIDTAPEGKAVGTIHVVNHEVFSSRDGYFRLANLLHRTTREDIIRREVLLPPGRPLRRGPDRGDGPQPARRRLLQPGGHPAGADRASRARSTCWWSPATSGACASTPTSISSEQVLVYLTTSLSENNLFGWRKKASFAFDLYRGVVFAGPELPRSQHRRHPADVLRLVPRHLRPRDRRARGQRASARGWRTRCSRWPAAGAPASRPGTPTAWPGATARSGCSRSTCAPPPSVEALPYIYKVRRDSADASLVRSFGKAVIQRVSAGYTLGVVRPRFHGSFPWPTRPCVRPSPPRSSPAPSGSPPSTPATRCSPRRYRVYRDYDTYDLREDAQLGPGCPSRSRTPPTGSGRNTYVGLSAALGWSFDLWDGFQRLSLTWGGRIRGGRLQDESRSAGVRKSAKPVLQYPMPGHRGNYRSRQA